MTTQSSPSGFFILGQGTVYNRQALYFDWRDQRGFYEQFNCKTTPDIINAIDRTLGTHPEYHNSRQNFLRNALTHQLHYDNDPANPGYDPMIDAALEAIRIRQTIEVEMMVVESHRNLIETIEKRLEQAAELGDWEAFDRMMIDLEDRTTLDSIPPGIQAEYADVYKIGQRLQRKHAN